MYDPSILEKYAKRLLNRAEMVWGLAFVMMLPTLFVAAFISQKFGETAAFWFFLAVAVVLLVWASNRAFDFKLEAQRTLCQLQIERNTRPIGGPIH
jgi:positive regulator of sigma E activity